MEEEIFLFRKGWELDYMAFFFLFGFFRQGRNNYYDLLSVSSLNDKMISFFSECFVNVCPKMFLPKKIRFTCTY